MQRSGQRLAAAMVLWIFALTCAAPFAPLFAAGPLKACCRTKAHRKCCCRTAKPGELAVTASKNCAQQCGVTVASSLLAVGTLPRRVISAAPAPSLIARAGMEATAETAPAAFAQFGRPPPRAA